MTWPSVDFHGCEHPEVLTNTENASNLINQNENNTRKVGNTQHVWIIFIIEDQIVANYWPHGILTQHVNTLKLLFNLLNTIIWFSVLNSKVLAYSRKDYSSQLFYVYI